jgi:hypothetical protein
MFLPRVMVLALLCACLLGGREVRATRRRKRALSGSDAGSDTGSGGLSREQQEALLSSLPRRQSQSQSQSQSQGRDQEGGSEDEQLELKARVPQLVEDVRFAVNNHGDVSLEKAAALDRLGRVVFRLGKYEQLLELSYEIVAIKEQLLGVDHVEVGAALRNIGTVTGKLQRQDECRRVLLRALKIHKIHYQPGSKDMAVLQAKMHQCGLVEDFLHSDGTSYEEYKQQQQDAQQNKSDGDAEL